MLGYIHIEPPFVGVIVRYAQRISAEVKRFLPELVGIVDVDEELGSGLVYLIVPGEEPQEPESACFESFIACPRPPH